MQIYYVVELKEQKNSAGSKAPDDIYEVCRRRGYQRLEMPPMPTGGNKVSAKLKLASVCNEFWHKVERTVSPGDVVLMQYPYYGKRAGISMIPKIREKKKCRFVAIVHDLESLRGGIAGVLEHNAKASQNGDEILLKEYDAVICHNEKMKAYLLSKGFDEKKLVCLEIFDYLSECPYRSWEPGEHPSLVVAGTLAIGKCGYIYGISDPDAGRNPNLKIHLYGNGYEESAGNANVIWHGSLPPTELPGQLQGDYGLVWDGPEITSCVGNTGEYLKYNNPHKTSLYLSAGLPVIVWKEAAIADFVLREQVGIAVESLEHIEETLAAVSPEEYRAMCSRVMTVSRQLREGYYFLKAFDGIIDNAENQS